MVKIPASNQIFYLLPELYAIVRSVPVVPMELTIPRVISFGCMQSLPVSLSFRASSLLFVDPASLFVG